MFSKSKIMIMLLITMTFTVVGHAWAGGVKERIRERLPVIKALKVDGVVGENNQGLLTIRKDTDQKGLIDAENKDRKMIYRIIAKQEGTTPDLVGKRRAIKIAQKAAAGTWIQGLKGGWQQK